MHARDSRRSGALVWGAFAGGAALGFGVACVALGGEPASTGPAGRASVSAAAVLERLDVLEALLREVPKAPALAPPTSGPAVAERTPVEVGTGSSPLQSELAQILRTVEGLAESVEKKLPVDSPPSRAQVLAAGTTRNWAALEDLWQLTQDRGSVAAADSVRFMSYDEVLQRFGAPTSIGFADNSWNLWYHRSLEAPVPGGDQEDPRSVRFIFVGGYVTAVLFDGYR